MSMRNTLDPQAGGAPAVDQMLGNAYGVVRAVALALDKIAYVANNLPMLQPKNIELQSTGTTVQWRYVGDTNWTDLFPFSLVHGRDPEFQVNGDYLQWRYVGDAVWTNLWDVQDFFDQVTVASTANKIPRAGADGTLDPAWFGYIPFYGTDPVRTITAKLRQLDGLFRFPSGTPTHSFTDLIVQNSGTFIDNVVTIQNLSMDGTNQGNAALRFADSVNSYERGAMGYSRVATGTPGGWYPNLMYVECGNLTADDPDDTDFAVVVTHGAGAKNFPNTSLKAIEVQAATGNVFLRTQGSGNVYVVGRLITQGNGVDIGGIGDVQDVAIGMQNTSARLRERDEADSFAITTNIGLTGNADDVSLPSWEVVFGGGTGGATDSFKIRRAPAGSTIFTDLFTVAYDGSLTVHNGFGANGATPQGKYPVYPPATDLTSALDLVNSIRIALINNGICVAAS